MRLFKNTRCISVYDSVTFILFFAHGISPFKIPSCYDQLADMRCCGFSADVSWHLMANFARQRSSSRGAEPPDNKGHKVLPGF